MSRCGPPRRSRVAATLAVVACGACCALPVMIGAGLLTGAGAAFAEQTLLTVAGTWWRHRRRSTAHTCGGSGGGSGRGCSRPGTA
ncbi:hypothetical protein [Herbidospora yilanensis]|uniref:hypothetical protein n=1 Tax=Herbidospora yilanensis TaxID=354426 RepID=UPI000A57AB4A|nr:hypothetical protein [Herbidospora yilanensis]